MGQVIQRSISEQKLDEAMRVFWERGYFGTSLDALIAITGFNKAAIYKHFGSKHGLFIAMLKRYREKVTPPLTAPLQQEKQGLKAIEIFFNQFQAINKQKLPKGCFLIVTASELPSHDKPVSDFIKKFKADLTVLFSKCLEHAKENNQLKTDICVKSVSEFLVTNIFGLMTLHRMGVSKRSVEGFLITLLGYLKTL